MAEFWIVENNLNLNLTQRRQFVPGPRSVSQRNRLYLLNTPRA